MQPYRGSRVDTPKLTAEGGIVDDMVRQFADPYAFLRELLQNGIDAGATASRLAWSAARTARSWPPSPTTAAT